MRNRLNDCRKRRAEFKKGEEDKRKKRRKAKKSKGKSKIKRTKKKKDSGSDEYKPSSNSHTVYAGTVIRTRSQSRTVAARDSSESVTLDIDTVEQSTTTLNSRVNTRHILDKPDYPANGWTI